jgi:large subunit ribosomal protein L18
MSSKKETARIRRKKHIRKIVRGTAERPRLSVFRSARHIYAQLIDDDSGRTLVAASSLKLESSGNKDTARQVGQELAKSALDAKVDTVVFDRNGYLYHGRVAALADGAREAGLKF